MTTVPDRIDALFSHLEGPGMPGAAVAVLDRGELIHRKGYGFADIEAGIALQPDTPYPIASTTKQFTTTCVLLLEEEGRLSLQDDYRKYLPEMPDFGSPITIDHLCTNTSGIRDIFALVTLAGGKTLDPRPRELVEEVMARQRSLNFPTGSQYRYSNPNFQMLSWIIERITGRRLAEFMAERIFKPLGMKHTELIDVRGGARKGGARCYDGNTKGDLRPSEWEAFSRGGSGEGGGAIWSTLDDLILWERNFSHNIIGSAGLLDGLRCAPRIPGGDERFYARGLFVGTHRGLDWSGHGGSFGPGASNRVQFSDRQLSVIVLSNSHLFDPQRGAFEVADVVLDRDPAVPPAPRYAKADADELRPWFGTYEDPGSGLSFGIGEKDGTAQLVLVGAAADLETMGNGTFVANRGYSLPARVSPGQSGSPAEIAVQLGPNPPMRMTRCGEPSDGLGRFEGTYVDDELGATHTVEVENGHLTAAIESPLGRREGVLLERTSERGFVAQFDDERRGVYRFTGDPGAPPTGAMASIIRAEGLSVQRVT